MSVTRLGLLAVVVCGAVLATASAQVPPPFRPAPAGLRAELSVPGPEGKDWTLRVYRRRTLRPRSKLRTPGSVDYCLALDQGGRARGALCALSAAIALRVDAEGIWLDCGGLGIVVGEPVPPGPTCGLVRADASAVTVGADGAPPQAAVLSEPFALRVNRSARVLRRSGIDPRRVRRLPHPPRVRAFLAIVDGPATPPGERTPRLTVTVTDPSSPIVRTIGGWRIPEELDGPPQFPRPAPGAKRVRLSARSDGGRVLRTTSWRSRDRSLCVKLRDGRGAPLAGLSCWGGLPLIDQLVRKGTVGPIHAGPGARGCCAAYGFARGDAVAVQLVASDGRSRSAKLSRAWTTVRRGPRRIKVRAYLTVLPNDPAFDDGVEVRTTLADGRVLTYER